ncbi:MAG: hypothetical protein EOP56_04155 [Sphingobacteriales bacterium]|nr:MAG: hypothetical protein EOP56_04155 [Sphingobacteriales bacterium]
MKQIIFIASLVGALFISAVAEAQPHSRRNINRAQQDQRHRIQHGVRNGSLTKREAMQLRNDQSRIRHYKQMAMADGRMSRKERMFIRKQQKHMGRNIYAQKHDRQFRGKGYGRYNNNGGGSSWNNGRYNERQFRHK